MNIPDDIYDLTIRYLSDEISPGEWQKLKSWIDLSDEHRKAIRDVEEVWFSAIEPDELKRFDKEAAFQNFVQQTQIARRPAALRRRIVRSVACAAAVALFFGVGYVAYQEGSKGIQSKMTGIAVEAPMGSRTQTTLPDGTRVWLNAGSTLAYDQAFGINSREVSLKGEGYFVVTHDAAKPFVVSSGGGRVKVLGTKFNFRDYPSDSCLTVDLDEGSVMLTDIVHPGHKWKMKPGQHVSLNKTTGHISLAVGQTKGDAWTSGRFILGGESMAEIAVRLQRQYNVKMVFANPDLRQLHFHGEFGSQDATLDDVLEALAATNKIRYKKEGGRVVFY